ncbi:MAG: TolC family protein [Ignavibacteria bacterium]|nr:TolC family protein [Ignavibacteria bacterium]
MIQLNHLKRELPDSIIEKRLLALALTNPAFDAAKHNNKINEYQLKAAKNAWLNLLTLSANYNDQTFSNTSNTGQVVYPKYFTGITIPLGSIFSKTSVKAAKEQVEIGNLNQEMISRNIRTEVLGKYKQFKTYETFISPATGCR